MDNVKVVLQPEPTNKIRKSPAKSSWNMFENRPDVKM